MDTVIWSTRGVQPAQVAAYWTQALHQIMPGLHFDPIGKSFEAKLEARRRIGVLRCNLVTTTPQRVLQQRRARLSPEFGLIYVKCGMVRVRQFARTAEVHAGEFAMIDGNESAEVIVCRDSETFNISAPAAWLQLWLPRPETEAAKTFTAARPETRPLLSLLELLSCSTNMQSASEDLVVNQLGGALALAVGAGDVVGTRHSARLLNRLRQGINARYFDPSYGPRVAAEDAGISRRYLVALFAAANSTFNTELIQVRLERSAEMLRSPRFASQSILDVALRCGFSDASHFSKRFRARYSMPPAAYRLAKAMTKEDSVAAIAMN